MIDTLCTRAETLCRRIAPLDLGNAPFYIVPQSRVPDDLGGKSICDGFTAPNLDLYLKDVIGPAWRGRGACLVVNDTDFSKSMDAMDIESAMLAIVLHELAHILERPVNHRAEVSADPMRLKFEALCLGNAVSQEPASTKTIAPFQRHGHRFIRTALHLRHRAEMAGVLVPLYCYCAGNQYGLSHPNRYRDALGDEPARLAGHRIREILGTPYPKAFWHLWTTDMAHWFSDGNPKFERSLSQ